MKIYGSGVQNAGSDMVLVLLTDSDFTGTGSQSVEHYLAGKVYDRMPMDVKVISLKKNLTESLNQGIS
jgi:hypothetical protein